MKFRVTMKDPDTLHDAIADAVKEDVKAMTSLDEDKQNVVRDQREEKVRGICAKWFEYGEYLTIEIDTNARTAIVIDKEP